MQYIRGLGYGKPSFGVIALMIAIAIIANILGFGRAIPTAGGW